MTGRVGGARRVPPPAPVNPRPANFFGSRKAKCGPTNSRNPRGGLAANGADFLDRYTPGDHRWLLRLPLTTLTTVNARRVRNPNP
jgi:hypothetical protein